MALQSIGFIGAGRMATALASGLVAANRISGSQIRASDPSAEARQAFADRVGGSDVSPDNARAASAKVVVLAVKPQYIVDAVGSIRDIVTDRTLVVSIAAGVPIGKIEAELGTDRRVVRVMPNTPCLVGYGTCGYSLGGHCTPADGELVAEILSAVGESHLVNETQLDAVTGLSGSGPAFVYSVVEALAEGGVEVGLPPELSAALAATTVRGAAEMVVATGETPSDLRQQVMSPGGTTVSGLRALEQAGLREALIAAVTAATKRSQELGQQEA